MVMKEEKKMISVYEDNMELHAIGRFYDNRRLAKAAKYLKDDAFRRGPKAILS